MPRLELFPFRYREPFTGKWAKARYRAERHEIAARYQEWEITGPPEIRDVDPNARYFTPWKVVPHAELMRMEELPPEMQPHLAMPPGTDELEAFLAKLFLRRYVTYCARRRRYSQMQAAAHLLATLPKAAQTWTAPDCPIRSETLYGHVTDTCDKRREVVAISH